MANPAQCISSSTHDVIDYSCIRSVFPSIHLYAQSGSPVLWTPALSFSSANSCIIQWPKLLHNPLLLHVGSLPHRCSAITSLFGPRASVRTSTSLMEMLQLHHLTCNELSTCLISPWNMAFFAEAMQHWLSRLSRFGIGIRYFNCFLAVTLLHIQHRSPPYALLPLRSNETLSCPTNYPKSYRETMSISRTSVLWATNAFRITISD